MELASDRLGLPLLAVAQAQKEMTHNEALVLADLAIQAVVEAVGVAAPPATPAPGQCWMVGAEATGAWAGQAQALAGWTAGGWRFVRPREGFRVWSKDDGCEARFVGDSWVIGEACVQRLLVNGQQVVGARQAAITWPAGGETIDSAARVAIGAILSALRTHGLTS